MPGLSRSRLGRRHVPSDSRPAGVGPARASPWASGLLFSIVIWSAKTVAVVLELHALGHQSLLFATGSFLQHRHLRRRIALPRSGRLPGKAAHGALHFLRTFRDVQHLLALLNTQR